VLRWHSVHQDRQPSRGQREKVGDQPTNPFQSFNNKSKLTRAETRLPLAAPKSQLRCGHLIEGDVSGRDAITERRLQRIQERDECLLLLGAQFAEPVSGMFGLASMPFDRVFQRQ
jgi:hypothetical protein